MNKKYNYKKIYGDLEDIIKSKNISLDGMIGIDWNKYNDITKSIISNELFIENSLFNTTYDGVFVAEDSAKDSSKDSSKDSAEDSADIFIGNFKQEFKDILNRASKESKISIKIVESSCGTPGYIGVMATKPNSVENLAGFWKVFEALRDEIMVGAVVETIKRFDTSKIRPGRSLDL